MKNLLIFIMLIPVISFSQNDKGHAWLGATTFFSDAFGNTVGITAGAGYLLDDYLSLGVGFDVFPFSKKTPKFGQVYGDIRAFLTKVNNRVRPFIAVQPGLIIYGKSISNVNTKGSFAINGVIGIMGKSSKTAPGIFFAMGYSNISFKTSYGGRSVTTKYGGFKGSIGLSF